MDSLIKNARYLIVALCLLTTVGSAVNLVTSYSGSTEEISLKTEFGEASEKLHQRRKTEKATPHPKRLLFNSPRYQTILVPAFTSFSHPTERCRLNGFGGYLRN